MKRVLYFTGYRMVAQEWMGHKLVSSVYFEPDEQGLDLFSAYLRSFRNEPVRLLVDLIEEEFRQIHIPLLRGSDRQTILKRNYAKYFRTSEYRFAISQSVERKTRKEEKLLLIGLTNQYLLEPWLKIVEETRTPLSGIVSLPLLSEDYVKELKSESRAIILVSQQVPSNLRQSVFVDGKLVLSRLVPIASFYQGDYASDVLRDIESTQRYLISQRIVERSETIAVHIITNKRHFDKLTLRCQKESFFDFTIHEINELLAREKIDVSDEQDFSSGLYCYLVSKKIAINHYAQARERRYFMHYCGGLALRSLSIALLALGLGIAMTSSVKGLLYNSVIAETNLIEQKYKAKYNQLSENRIDSTTSTTNMQNIVQTVETLQNNYLRDPEEMLAMISGDISIFPDIRVKKIDWFVADFSDLESANEVHWDKPKKRPRTAGKNKDPNVPKPKKGYFEIAQVEGEFLNFDGNFRYALSAVDDLEKTMRETGKYFSVEITKRPLDIESGNRLSGDASGTKRGAIERAELAFRVVREVPKGE
ncbi:MAG: hypothetical protein OEO19_20390 [Gammaproteobacteria bacterium]|nr:hypothetical protein [Gammaproteobacteria bacterium]MDH3450654.1 hypothetical protein [Gammaproteobacteria bacterium]